MSGLAKPLFFVVDLLLLNLSITLAFSLKPASSTDWIYLLIYSNLAWLFLSLVSNPYGITKTWTLSQIIKSQLVFLFIHLCVITSLVFFFKRTYSLWQIGLLYATFVPLYFIFRLLIFYIRKIKTDDVLRNYLIIGKNEIADEIRKYYSLNPHERFRFVGQIDSTETTHLLTDIKDFCDRHDVHQIFWCAPNASPQQLNDLVSFGLESLIQVKIVVETASSSTRILSFQEKEFQATLEIAALPIDDAWNQSIKRLFDSIFSLAFVMLILSWLLPLIAIMIKVDSRGPVFFVQKRNGLKNRPFGCIKFRTMVVNQEADTKQATKDDARITSVGKFLRKSSIDELPQFINVLKGEMSLIGPRPHPIKLNEKFAVHIQNLMARHYVKPGITGLAQCLGYRGETKDLADMENRVRLDRYYIEHWSFWLDIKIVFLTVVSLLRGSEKAY
jgi:undecaprenyl-phosphate galactose phosphotransferase/putative colanic acid biosynthesis UDP-glucose lipid carrier transferase